MYEQCWPLFGPRPSTTGLAQWPKRPDGPSRSAHGAPAQRAVTMLGTGAAATGASAAEPVFGLHGELHGEMGGLPGKERRMGSHRGEVAMARQRG
jgi:hypothetical protein